MATKKLIPVLILLLAPAVPAGAGDGNWPSFRGHQASGVAEGHPLANEFHLEEGKNVRFRVPVPGLGHASPIVWGDRVFVVTAVGAGEASLKVGLYGDIDPVEDEGVQTWRLFALDKRSGELVWDKVVHQGEPAIPRHTKASHANSTPATDGSHLVVFLGSEGLHVFDLDGNLRWKKDLGLLDSGFFRVPDAQWGFGSSPVIHDGRVIVQCDVQKSSFLAAFDAADGRELWRVARDEVPTWSSPTVHAGEDLTQVVVNGFRHIGGYDFATGEKLWWMAGAGDIPVPTPILGDGLVYITNAHGGPPPIYAVPLGSRGEVAKEKLAWSHERNGAYMPTPILYGDHLYVGTDRGVLGCFDAKTGEELYRERLFSGTGMTASAVAGDGKLYYTNENGDVFVVRAGPEYELLEKNSLGEEAMATPAISEGTVYFRTRRHLVAVGKKEAPSG